MPNASDSPPKPIKSHRATGRITLSDVARAAGVSPSTVSRALRGERAVDPALIERVQAVSTLLGYVPDPAARALASQRSDHVAVLIPKLSNTLFVELKVVFVFVKYQRNVLVPKCKLEGTASNGMISEIGSVFFYGFLRNNIRVLGAKQS